MPPPQGISFPINFLRQDNSFQDPIANNLSSNNPAYPYASVFNALFAALGLTHTNYARVGLVAGQVIASGVVTAIIFDTVISDVDGIYNAVNGRFTPNVAGNFLCVVTQQWSTNLPDGVQQGISVQKNGSEVAFSF